MPTGRKIMAAGTRIWLIRFHSHPEKQENSTKVNLENLKNALKCCISSSKVLSLADSKQHHLLDKVLKYISLWGTFVIQVTRVSLCRFRFWSSSYMDPFSILYQAPSLCPQIHGLSRKASCQWKGMCPGFQQGRLWTELERVAGELCLSSSSSACRLKE